MNALCLSNLGSEYDPYSLGVGHTHPVNEIA